MVATLKGPTFGPYYCSNCMIRQPELRCTCIFCGDHFSNFEDRIIEEDAETFILNMKAGELQNENDIHRENRT